MSEQLTNILTPLFLTVVTALGALASYGLTVLTDHLKTKTKAIKAENTRAAVNELLCRTQTVIDTAVQETSQTLVANLKSVSADGSLTKEEAAAAFKQTYDNTKSLLGEKAYAELAEMVPDVDAWLISSIEAAVLKNK